MSNEPRKYRAICFDLDGTLLPMDIDEFMSAYFKRIAAWAGSHGLDAERFMLGLKAGVKAMAANNGEQLNSDAFWTTFETTYGEAAVGCGTHPEHEIRKIANEFYEKDFVHIGDGFEADPAAARVLDVLAQKGYPLVLATMPMFPLRAVQHRLNWAGVDPNVFERITNYANSTAAKPRQTYFAEVLASMGLRGEDVLMVGNNTMEDLSFLDLGVDAYLITDWLLDPVGFDMSTVKHGSMADFEQWVNALPECEDPVTGIQEGSVAHEETVRAFKENAVESISQEEMDAKAALVANAVAGNHESGAAGSLKYEA